MPFGGFEILPAYLGICSENFQLDQIKNGRLSAVINFNMPDI